MAGRVYCELGQTYQTKHRLVAAFPLSVQGAIGASLVPLRWQIISKIEKRFWHSQILGECWRLLSGELFCFTMDKRDADCGRGERIFAALM
ncbi:MAG: hypothetical protein ACOCYU_02390 [Brevefilum sp.]